MKELKRLLCQRSTWTGIAAIATGVGLVVAGNVSEGVQTIIAGAGIIFIREAIAAGSGKAEK